MGRYRNVTNLTTFAGKLRWRDTLDLSPAAAPESAAADLPALAPARRLDPAPEVATPSLCPSTG